MGLLMIRKLLRELWRWYRYYRHDEYIHIRTDWRRQ
jgi:hypothetical protein